MKREMYWQAEEGGVFTLYGEGRPLLSASAAAQDAETGETIDSRRAKAAGAEEEAGGLKLTWESGNLVLTEYLSVGPDGAAVRCGLRRKDGKPVSTRSLKPLIAHGKEDDTPYLWRALGAKMLLVTYDNDMWMRY